MPADVFVEISLLLAFAAAVSMIMRLLRQPLIIGHIITGIIVGPAVLGLIHSEDAIETLGKFGIALLLFIVGLGLNPRLIRELGKVSFVTGIGQVIVTAGISFLIVIGLGYDQVTAVYLSVALAFSSTIIVLKLLSDKKEHTKLHGRIAIGFLLVQDLIATFALVIATASGVGDGLSLSSLLWLSVKGVAMGGALFALTYFVVRPATNFLARSQELLFIFAIAWGFGIGALFYKIGFSLEVGALFGGVALASMPYAADIGAKLRPLRDFFVIVFFISLGAGLELTHIGSQWIEALLLALFVIISKPIVVLVLMGMMGYTKRTSFKTSIAIAQISEFSLIFLLVGLSNGQIPEEVVGLATMVAIITFALSSYLIIYSDKLYQIMERYLTLFERRKVKFEQEHTHDFKAVLLGWRKGGQEFARILRRIKKPYVVVDYDPEVINDLDAAGENYLYGDATDPELLDELGLERAEIVMVTITNEETVDYILAKLRAVKSKALVICVADTLHAAQRFYDQGATYVLVLHSLSSTYLNSLLNKTGGQLTSDHLKPHRDKHMEYLRDYAAVQVQQAKDKNSRAKP